MPALYHVQLYVPSSSSTICVPAKAGRAFGWQTGKVRISSTAGGQVGGGRKCPLTSSPGRLTLPEAGASASSVVKRQGLTWTAESFNKGGCGDTLWVPRVSGS